MDLVQIATNLVPPAASLFTNGQIPDLISIADLKLELNLAETLDDPYLAKLVTRASQAAATWCKRPFVASLWQDQIYPRSDPYPWQTPPRLQHLKLSQWPLIGGPSTAGTSPPQAPVLGSAAGGTLAAKRYYVRISYVTAQGETAASLESTLACAADALITVAAPGADPQNLATSWNVYVGTTSFGETLQATGLGVNSSWTLPTSGLVAGAAPPTYMTIVEGTPLAPAPLGEGIDFLSDPDTGLVTRLWAQNGQPRNWGFPITAIYQAGFTAVTMDADLQEAVILLAKMRWYGRGRDPMIRTQNVVGAFEATYWGGTGIGGQGDMPVDVTEKLQRYRVPTVA